MKRAWLVMITAGVLLAPSGSRLMGANPGISLIGTGFVPGSALDKSGLAGQPICQRDDSSVCIDQATLGGFGSGIAYTGFDDVFIAVPDRGPFDGRTDTPYLDRFHFLHMTVDVGAAFPNIQTTLLDTRLLKTHGNQDAVGDAYAFSSRFDPEGAAIGLGGSVYVSDEYGPTILQFNREGHLLSRVSVPEKFLLAPDPLGHPSGDVDAGGNSLELYPAFNVFGRQANRGMEGLAITPDGSMLVGIMQNALLQDNAFAVPITRAGVNNRILTVDLRTGATHEYVYVMDAVNQGRGVNDIVAVNSHEFLVLERDNRTNVPTPPNTAASPNLKRIYKIDLAKAGLTDVSSVGSLPLTAAALATAAPGGTPIVPVTKTLFIDLLDPSYKVNATQTIKDVIAEKVEGLAWGPDLPDGRHVLYVLSDNDLFPGLPTQIYAFAVDGAAAGITYEPQQVDGPMFPPGQVKKASK